MILPHSETVLILLMALCMLCWGAWPVFFKLAKKYRFELFYFDFSLGLALFAVICALTVGSLGFDGFTFRDDLLNARYQEWLNALLAAMIFNFGNMLMMSAISVAGMAVAFPLSFGMALIVSTGISYVLHPGMNITVVGGATILMLCAIVASSSAYSHLKVLQHESLARAGKTKSTRRPNSLKGVILALVGGLVMGSFNPLLMRAQNPDDGVGPYSLLFLFAAAVVASTFVYNLFFMNLPVEGDPLEIGDYFRTSVKNHILGLTGGIVWGLGAIAVFVAETPKGEIRQGPPLSVMLAQGAPIVAAILGLFVWNEFRDGDARAKGLAAVSLVLFACGLLLFSFAPVWIVKQ